MTAADSKIMSCGSSADTGIEDRKTVQPRAFVSYSWSSQEHQERVRSWADRLMGDGVDVVLDVYDLKEGSDKYAFMERMVTDPTVSHVLVFCDREYARKADDRSAGVGVESQIISKEIYDKVEQSTFIPIICEFDEAGEATLPAFMKSRIWIDFSSEEKANASWERLIRLLHGRPQHAKPPVGSRPKYLEEDAEAESGLIRARFRSLETAVVGEGRDVGIRRSDFLDACMEYADELRIRENPDEQALGARVIEDCRKLVVVRDAIVDWVALEMSAGIRDELPPMLTVVLERLLKMKARPAEVTRWSDDWFGAQSVFVYETFLYVVATLIREQGFHVVRSVFETHYMLPETERHGESFGRFDRFQGHSRPLSTELIAPNGQRYLSAEAELFKRQATRTDISFKSLMEAELLVLMVAMVGEGLWWYPGTLHYADYSWVPPLFLRATRHADFVNLGRAVGIDDAETLQEAVRDGCQEKLSEYGTSFGFRPRGNLLGMMNIGRLDTLP